MYHVRTNHLPSPFSARYEYVAPPEPEAMQNLAISGQGGEEPEECMEQKQDIMQEREERKAKKGKRGPPLPGQRLLRKLAKNQQLEEALTRVVKSLHK
jgi:hypothetical protein